MISIPEGSNARKCRAAPFRQNLAHELAHEYVSRFGLTSSAAGRRIKRSEGAPIPTICCGVCAARLLGASSAVCSSRRREHARDVVGEACFAACWWSNTRGVVKKLLCAGRMIVIKIFPINNAVLWMISAGTSRKVGGGGKWQSEWSVLWSGGRNDETACKLIARGRCHGLRQVLQMLGEKTGRGVGACGCRWIVLWKRGRHDETAC